MKPISVVPSLEMSTEGGTYLIYENIPLSIRFSWVVSKETGSGFPDLDVNHTVRYQELLDEYEKEMKPTDLLLWKTFKKGINSRWVWERAYMMLVVAERSVKDLIRLDKLRYGDYDNLPREDKDFLLLLQEDIKQAFKRLIEEGGKV